MWNPILEIDLLMKQSYLCELQGTNSEPDTCITALATKFNQKLLTSLVNNNLFGINYGLKDIHFFKAWYKLRACKIKAKISAYGSSFMNYTTTTK
jgi:hypothetical protein